MESRTKLVVSVLPVMFVNGLPFRIALYRFFQVLTNSRLTLAMLLLLSEERGEGKK